MRLQPPHSWFPFILVALSVTLLLVIVVWVQPSSSGIVIQVQDPVTEEEYQEALLSILQNYSDGGGSAKIYEELIDMKVPASYKDLHLELVIAFGFLKSGDIPEGEARLDLLRETYDWLP